MGRRRARARFNGPGGPTLTTDDPDPCRTVFAYAESLFAAIREPLLVLDERFIVRSVNDAYLALFGVTKELVVNQSLFDLANGPWVIPGLRTLLEGVRDQTGDIRDLKVQRTFEGIGSRTVALNARRIISVDGAGASILFFVDDIT